MDNATVEKLAKKRALLDLLPAREEKLEERKEELAVERYKASSFLLDNAVVRAQNYYIEVQTQAAVLEYKALGVDDKTARRQIVLRPDFAKLAPPLGNLFRNYHDAVYEAKALLWCYEAFEAGFPPLSPEGLEIKKKWFPSK
jgi:hypothetical protein